MKFKINKILPFLFIGSLLLAAVYFFFYPLYLTKTASSGVYILEYKLVGGFAGNYDDLKIDKNFVYKYRFQERIEKSGKLNLLEVNELNNFLKKYGVINFSSTDSSPDTGPIDKAFSSLRFQGNNKTGPKDEEIGEISSFANKVIFRIKLLPSN